MFLRHWDEPAKLVVELFTYGSEAQRVSASFRFPIRARRAGFEKEARPAVFRCCASSPFREIIGFGTYSPVCTVSRAIWAILDNLAKEQTPMSSRRVTALLLISLTAADILGAHGGHGMAHFGKGHWEPLGG